MREGKETGGRHPLIPESEGECVWMHAGVLSYWLCDQDYRCESCPLDAAIRHSCLAEYPGNSTSSASRTARGSLKVPVRDAPARGEAVTPDSTALPACDRLAGLLQLQLPELEPGFRYHATHTWVCFDAGERVRIGIDPFAAAIAGRLRSVVVPQPGTRVRRGHPCAWLDDDGGTLTVLSPLTGVIVDVNPCLARSPEMVERDPLGAGWLLDLEASHLDLESHGLVEAGPFARRLAGDVERWQRRVREAMRTAAPRGIGQTLADGGARVTDVGQLIGARRHHEIAASFLCTPGARK